MQKYSLHALYQQAYCILANVTPLPADCGALCGSRCCKGDKSQGMILFPGEWEYLQSPSFLSCQKREMQGISVDFAVCNGHCPRNLRPLSCRVFPFAPYLSRGTLSVIADPRARYLCPLLQCDAEGLIQQGFCDSIHRAFAILRSDEMVSAFLQLYSNMLDQYRRFVPPSADK